jgi:hypothetical protein
MFVDYILLFRIYIYIFSITILGPIIIIAIIASRIILLYKYFLAPYILKYILLLYISCGTVYV